MKDFISQEKKDIQTPEEVAKFLRKSCSWVYKNKQELGGVKLGGSLFFPSKEDLYERLFRQEKEVVEVRLRPQRAEAWEDVNLQDKYLVLYTRKKKGGNLTPRKIPMTSRLFKILDRRFKERDTTKKWVFWHTYYDRKEKKFVSGPYKDRKMLMKKLCEKAGVKYFRYHPLRHSGASVMDSLRIPIGSIQRLLGHENRTTTEIYLHSIGDSERMAVDIFEKGSSEKVPPEVPPIVDGVTDYLQ